MTQRRALACKRVLESDFQQPSLWNIALLAGDLLYLLAKQAEFPPAYNLKIYLELFPFGQAVRRIWILLTRGQLFAVPSYTLFSQFCKRMVADLN
jgi:hypothetical protein